MVTGLEQELRVLKSIANLQQIPRNSVPDVVHNKLVGLEASLEILEQKFEDFDIFLDMETQNIEKLQLFAEYSNQQLKQIQDLQSKAPSFLMKENFNMDANVRPNELSGDIKSITVNTTKPKVRPETIKLKEFDNIPKSTKGRITLAQINESLSLLYDMFNKKEKLIKPCKKNKKQHFSEIQEYETKRVREHGSETFLTENEIRGSKIFQSGIATGTSILHTLRALHRLRMIRATGETTYILQKA
eukprot:CAMPEP_0182437976 /NCGR_PEP_ID=MMETSP1167-20130531/85422_1 /TAXON_ID=2988 /ORGANISM="Mallomonas Sp, Strain CCMP3275" /LENGTH=244 /DNA_ID=CAMNT_0024631107 /DNA_START=78 /DNA_END=812 /DNA_ORIENTATION=-